MMAALTVLMGFQLVLSFLNYDIASARASRCIRSSNVGGL